MAAAPSVSDLLSGGPAPAITIQRAAERTAYFLGRDYKFSRLTDVAV